MPKLSTSRAGQRTELDEFFVDYYRRRSIRRARTKFASSAEPPGLVSSSTPRSVEDFATVCVAITLSAKDGVCEDVRLGLNSVASTIIHAKRAEQTLRGKTIDDDLLRQMGEVAASETDPVDDNRGTAEYKREMVKVLVCRAAKEALQRVS
jgi:carbon-monoxide dehydrogenase medium subunit